MKKIITPRFLMITGIISFVMLLSVISRLIPHIPNFFPIIAIALFAGSVIKDKRIAFGLPLAIMFISDLIIGFHATMWAVYLGVLTAGLIGYFFIKKAGFGNVLFGALGSAVIFFVITNFAVWAMDTFKMYPDNFYGLMVCFDNAIPFFRTTLISNLAFSFVLFGGFALAGKYSGSVEPAYVKSDKR